MKRRWSLRFYIPVFLLTFTLILIVVLGYTGYRVSRDLFMETVLDSFSREAFLAKQEMTEFLEGQVTKLRAIAGTPPIPAIFRARDHGDVDPVSGDDLDTWRHRLEQIIISSLKADRGYGRTQLRLVDAEGYELVRVNRMGNTITAVAGSELQDEARRYPFPELEKLQAGEYYVSTIDLKREGEQVVIPPEPTLRVAVPIFDDQERKRGLLVANLDPRALFDQLEHHDLFGNIYLVNQDREFLLHPDPEKTFAAARGMTFRLRDEHPDLDVLLDAHEAYISRTPRIIHGNERHFDGFVKLHYNPLEPSMFWAFLYDISAEKVLGSMYTLRRNLLLLSLAILTLFMVVGYHSARRHIINPLIALAEATQRVAAGDYRHKLPESGRGDELDLLTRSFNQMVANLEQSQAELEASREKYHTLFQHSHDGILIHDLDGRLLEINKKGLTLFQYEPEEFAKLSLADLLPPEALSSYQMLVEQSAAGETANFVTEFRRKGGDLFPAEVTLSQLEIGGRAVVNCVLRDLTADREARHEIERLAAFPQENPAPVVEVDAQGAVTYINAAGEQLLREMQECNPRLQHILPPDYPALARESLRTGRDISPREVMLCPAATKTSDPVQSGEAKILLWTGHPIPSLNLVHFYAADISELKRTEQQLLRAKEQAETSDRLKSNFLRTMSHEVRTPLNVMLGYLDLLAHDLQANLTPEEQEFMETIRQNGDRLKRLMDDILDISLIESDRTAMHFDTHPADDLVRKAVVDIRVSAREKGLRIVEEYQAQGTVISVDDIRFLQALGNLLQNAVKFTNEGRITVTTEVKNGEYHVAVADTGVGIRESFKPYLFSLFRQAEEGYRRGYEGAGLGLAISQRLIAAMHGRIEVVSEEGQGSTFTIILPAAQATLSGGAPERGPAATNAEETTAGNDASPAELNGHHRLTGTVLVVEDNPGNRMYLEFLLKKLGLPFISAHSGEQALELLQEKPVQCLLVDISLAEGMSGVEFLQTVRKDAACRSLPAVAVTAHTMKGMREEFLQEGFDAFLAKPFTKKELQAVLRRFLSHQHQMAD
jgi:PAS domain S-box-containing protein